MFGRAWKQTYQRLTLGIHFGAVKRMARHNLDVGRKVFIKCGELRSFAGRLTTDDGTDLGGFGWGSE